MPVACVPTASHEALSPFCLDAFTNQWQKKLQQRHSTIDSYQMMFAVNLWSIAMTAGYLLLTGEGRSTVDFITTNPAVMRHLLLASLTSALGQLFIYDTILAFGPVTLTIIMNTRQIMAMVVSCVLFRHPLSPTSYLGAALVFAAVFFRSFRSYRELQSARPGGTPTGKKERRE